MGTDSVESPALAPVDGSGSGKKLKIALGVGLGIGLLITAMCVVYVIHSRREIARANRAGNATQHYSDGSA